MFERARRSLALRYVVLFIVVLAVFSAIFLFALAIGIRPAFDLAPELPDEQQGRASYFRTIGVIVIALGVADVVVVGIVAALAYWLAGRTRRMRCGRRSRRSAPQPRPRSRGRRSNVQPSKRSRPRRNG